MTSPTEAYNLLHRLHAAVDHMAEQVASLHQQRLQCKRGCAGCCVDGLTVFAIEAERLRRNQDVLAEGAGEAGMCAFLDADGGCRVYADRPYVCRTQGLPLRWLDLDEGGEVVELRDICPLNAEGEPITALDEEACFTLGVVEAKLAELQAAFGVEGERVALRSLFEES